MIQALTRQPVREQTRAEQIEATGGEVSRFAAQLPFAECPVCNTVLASGSIVELDFGEDDPNESNYAGSVYFAFFCAHCNHVVKFTLKVDKSDPTRLARPAIPFDHRIYRGRKRIDEFLTLYPEARGIVESC